MVVKGKRSWGRCEQTNGVGDGITEARSWQSRFPVQRGPGEDLRVVREEARAGGEVQLLFPLQDCGILLQVLPEAALEERT